MTANSLLGAVIADQDGLAFRILDFDWAEEF